MARFNTPGSSLVQIWGNSESSASSSVRVTGFDGGANRIGCALNLFCGILRTYLLVPPELSGAGMSSGIADPKGSKKRSDRIRYVGPIDLVG